MLQQLERIVSGCVGASVSLSDVSFPYSSLDENQQTMKQKETKTVTLSDLEWPNSDTLEMCLPFQGRPETEVRTVAVRYTGVP